MAGSIDALWQRRGPAACALLPLAGLFGLAAAARRLWWRCSFARPWRAPVPVVVVGNLTAGGAGKTPTVIALVRHLQAAGWHPGVVSRGYGRRDPHTCLEVTAASGAAEAGDEPLVIARATGAPLVVAADRPAAARRLLARHADTDILVSDDGLQHYALARDVEIAVFDERGAGNGWLLPAGPLREPLARAVDLVLYNAPAPSTPLPGYLATRRLAGSLPLAAWAGTEPATRSWQPLTALAGQRIAAAAGIGHPQRFFDMLRAAGVPLAATLALPDHAAMAARPFAALAADVVLVTEKDAVKCLESDDPRIRVVGLDYAPEPAFVERLDALLATRRPH